ncbi:hypothetical protein C8J57DRAFT_498385 [Mycena rebaudengoi]|nr:hypothetical protein C8J57DRAFT_498385 [Mycena rebaudengoi]
MACNLRLRLVRGFSNFRIAFLCWSCATGARWILSTSPRATLIKTCCAAESVLPWVRTTVRQRPTALAELLRTICRLRVLPVFRAPSGRSLLIRQHDGRQGAPAAPFLPHVLGPSLEGFDDTAGLYCDRFIETAAPLRRRASVVSRIGFLSSYPICLRLDTVALLTSCHRAI